MTSNPILSRIAQIWQVLTPQRRSERPDLSQLRRHPRLLPPFVRASAVAMRYFQLLGPLDWSRFPERDLETDWGTPAVPYASFAAACLVKLDQQRVYMPQLRDYPVEHPALVWVLGFPLLPSPHYAWGFDADASLPTAPTLGALVLEGGLGKIERQW
jgi:hypothetical protein